MDDAGALAVAEALLANPTAPLVEDLPAAHVASVAAAAGLEVTTDVAGNVVVRHRGAGSAAGILYHQASAVGHNHGMLARYTEIPQRQFAVGITPEHGG